MVLPQAMACGLPLICTMHTAGEDLVSDGVEGFVIPAGDVAALKEKLVYLYRNREVREEMGQAALRRVAAGLTWDAYGERICREYSRVLHERKYP